MSHNQTLNPKIEKLAKDWKINIDERDWPDKLRKEYKTMKFNYIFSRVLILSVALVSTIIALIALFADSDSVILGIVMNQKTFAVALIISISSSLSMNAIGLKLRFDRLKTFLFLKELNQ